MEVLFDRCCGLDVHKKEVVACVITPGGKKTRTFYTMTDDLLELADWLAEEHVTHVAMESTGPYWKPMYNLLENEFTLVLGNAQHIKIVPGRKTDVKDAEWIADLLRHGLIKGSFVPDRAQRELRELLRYRRSLIQEHTREVNRIQKVLEGANIKLASVASDVLGVSGRAMLRAIADGVNDPRAIAGLAKGKLREKQDELEKSLKGLVGSHQRMVIACQLEHLVFLEEQINKLDKEIADRMGPLQSQIDAADSIPGIDVRTAQDILGEMGTDMNQFPDASHLASWAGVSPGNNRSAGKRRSGRTMRGNRWLKAALVLAARAAVRGKGNYLNSQYHRLVARRGDKKAILAVAHSILVMLYTMLKKGQEYQELGSDYFDKRNSNATVCRAVQRIEQLGFKVTLEVIQPAFS
jgi:transposase